MAADDLSMRIFRALFPTFVVNQTDFWTGVLSGNKKTQDKYTQCNSSGILSVKDFTIRGA